MLTPYTLGTAIANAITIAAPTPEMMRRMESSTRVRIENYSRKPNEKIAWPAAMATYCLPST